MKRRKTYSGDDARRVAELAAIAEAFRSRQLEVTAPLYQYDLRGRLVMVGSSVLVALGDAKFLVTAGHVLDMREKGPIVAGVSPDLVYVSGDTVRWRAVGSRSPHEDLIDVGTVRLRGGPWDTLPQLCFAAWEEIDIRAPRMACHTYGLVGFPITKNRRNVDGERIRSLAYCMAGLECAKKAYEDTGTNPQAHVMIGFVQNEMWGAEGMRTAPNLHGVSGSALWRYGRRIRDTTGNPLLSAIVVEWERKGRHKYILGTRIDVVMAALAEEYADIRTFIADRLA